MADGSNHGKFAFEIFLNSFRFRWGLDDEEFHKSISR